MKREFKLRDFKIKKNENIALSNYCQTIVVQLHYILQVVKEQVL